MIRLTNVNKSFGEQQVINGCDLLVQDARFASLMGKSGSGKSTLLAIIAGITNADSGKVAIDNQIISEMDEDSRAVFRLKNIGFVFQDFKLIPSLSVFENIYMAIHPRTDIGFSDKQARIRKLITDVGLTNKEGQVVDKLSGGEKQRVAIARSLVNEPVVVLADEPTGNLDSTTAENILDLFIDMHKRLATTFIIATHDMEIALKTEKIYSIKDGVIK